MVIVTKGSKGGTLKRGRIGGGVWGGGGGRMSGNFWPILLIFFMVIDLTNLEEMKIGSNTFPIMPVCLSHIRKAGF